MFYKHVCKNVIESMLFICNCVILIIDNAVFL